MQIEDVNIILASASPRRKDILNQVGIDFQVEVSDAEEIVSCDIPSEVVMELSDIKAGKIAKTHFEDLIIGADTVVAVDNKILGKAADDEEAFAMIKSLQGGVHSVFSGVTIKYRGRSCSFFEETKVYVYEMSDSDIRSYIDSKDGSGKAGNYAIQGGFARYIYRIEGDYNNVVGLPVARLMREINNMINSMEE